jgi:rhodanese-related sulfurtransferase
VRSSPFRIDGDVAQELVAEGAVLIDVRRRDDEAESPAGALRVAPDVIPERVAGLSTDVPIVLGCT